MEQNFITLEGGEGSGKTTVAKLLKEKLENLGYEVILTREPGGTKVSEKIRSIIFENHLNLEEESLLFAASRVNHINEVILPALKDGKIVISDRYVDSSIVYQQYVGKCENIQNYNKYAFDKCMPFKTFFFDIEPHLALKRLEDNVREQNRFDKKSLEFHQSIYEAYNKLTEEFPNRIFKVDATLSSELVANEILSMMDVKC